MGLQTTTVYLEKPIASVQFQGIDETSRKSALNDNSSIEANAPIESGGNQEAAMELQNQSFNQACQALQRAAQQLTDLRENIFKEHKQQIAKLSVEIARKVLIQKVQEGDYEIESIIEEALNNAPTHKEVVVHLNPEDLAHCQGTQDRGGNEILSNVKLTADSNIGRAECLLETPKGVIESAINEKLEIIGKALTKAQ